MAILTIPLVAQRFSIAIPFPPTLWRLLSAYNNSGPGQTIVRQRQWSRTVTLKS